MAEQRKVTHRRRIAFRDELCAAARRGIKSENAETHSQWLALVFGEGSEENRRSDDPGIAAWAETVTVEFALQIRARKKPAFLVAELEHDETRQRSLAAVKATERITVACIGLAISTLIGAGGIALAVALH